MGFVFERIDEEGKKYLKKFVSTSQVYYWAIDREREIILLAWGGGGINIEHPEKFVFFYKETIGKIYAYRKDTWKAHAEIDTTTWYLYEIRFPTVLEPKKEELILLVKEAFLAFGAGMEDVKADNTLLAEIANPIFVNDRRG